MFYLDASAIAPMFLIDAHSPKMANWLTSGRDQIVLSDFAAVEFAAIVSRRIRTGELDVDQADTVLGDFDYWRNFSTTRRLTSAGDIAACERLVRRFELKLQAPDALHIAIALGDGATLVTFDERQAQAMAALGACVVPG